MDSTSIRVPYKNLKQAEVEMNRLDSMNRSEDLNHLNSNGVDSNASSQPAQQISSNGMSMITLVLSCTVAAGVQFGWALQLSLLTPYIQVTFLVCICRLRVYEYMNCVLCLCLRLLDCEFMSI